MRNNFLSSSYQRLKSDSRIPVVLICLAVSVVFWFLISLSKVYSGRIVFPLKYINFPERRMVINELPKNIEVAVTTTGFEIISHRFGKKEDTLVFDVQSKMQGAKEISKDVMVIPFKALSAELAER